ncbi:MAG: neutral/alkaline non-lysosomal ceramidase N-terminal domain-containing protein [Pirellulales bacterium]|nr:neutral/alkaline non-lysosomal ceramidase N-terminal domain-containing protein [Pirellulales bacterium]
MRLQIPLAMAPACSQGCRWVWLAVGVAGLLAVVRPLYAAPDGWQAGLARVNITPTEPMWLSGYASRNRPAEGKIHDLWTKALVLQDAEGRRVALITLDLVGIDRQLSQAVCRRLEEQYGLSRDAVALCTSHTHSGPVVRGNLAPIYDLDPRGQALVESYTDRLADDIVQVVGVALKRLQPAALAAGEGRATFAVNRRNNPEAEVPQRRREDRLAGPFDHAVPVLAVRDLENRLLAVVAGYACHATVLDGYQWCGDWPGAAQLELEQRHPGSTALYWAGCGGDQNPLPRRTVALMEEYGRQFADAVDEVLARPMQSIGAGLVMRYSEIDLPLAEPPSRDELARHASGAGYQANYARLMLAQWDRDGALPRSYPYPIQRWRLGGAVDWIFLGGEVVVDYALRLKSQASAGRESPPPEATGDRPVANDSPASAPLAAPGAASSVWVASYSNDVMGYIPSRRVLAEGGYEGGESRFAYGLPAVWGEETERLIIDQVEQLRR